MVLISGIITLPSAAHTQRPGVSDGVSQCHFLYQFLNQGDISLNIELINGTYTDVQGRWLWAVVAKNL